MTNKKISIQQAFLLQILFIYSLFSTCSWSDQWSCHSSAWNPITISLIQRKDVVSTVVCLWSPLSFSPPVSFLLVTPSHFNGRLRKFPPVGLLLYQILALLATSSVPTFAHMLHSQWSLPWAVHLTPHICHLTSHSVDMAPEPDGLSLFQNRTKQHIS